MFVCLCECVSVSVCVCVCVWVKRVCMRQRRERDQPVFRAAQDFKNSLKLDTEVEFDGDEKNFE